MSDYAAWLLRTLVPLSSYGYLPTRRVEDVEARAVVVIGCDTGMGRALLMRLADDVKLTRIYAGCFTEEARSDLKKHTWCRPFTIDVRSADSVNVAAALISESEPNGVFAVVNVAGAMMGGPIEWTSTEIFRAEMDLNFFGLLNVAKSFVPQLRRAKQTNPSGPNTRFVAVTSTIAVMPSFPGLSGYASSKSAADTLVNTLRFEVRPFGIDVITVCPGITRTPFLSKGAEQMRRAWGTAPSQIKVEYGEEYAEWWAKTVQFGIDWLAHDPHDSIECLLDAVSSAWPKTRYFSGLDARLIARPAVHVPDFAWDGVLRIIWSVLGQPRPSGARL